jgi:hypothetical protein
MPDFFLYWDAQKSVNYILASKINACARRKGRHAGGGDCAAFCDFL